MKKLSIQILSALGMGLGAIGTVTAGNVTIPNTFSSGTPAVAAEVNANFNALATEVNDNDSRITTNSNDLATLQATVSALQNTITTLQADLTAANSTIASLQSDLASVQANSVLDLDGMLVYAEDNNGIPIARFTGVNVQVVNGADQTTVNGRGNLIVGYNEEYVSSSDFCADGAYDNRTDCENNGAYWAGSFKSGSHNLVVGSGHSYSQYGGVVFGYRNIINRANATVTGGRFNLASGINSNVSGGDSNTSSGYASSVSGGSGNTTSGYASSASGGINNTASGDYSSVSGGYNRSATASNSWAAGGLSQSQ